MHSRENVFDLEPHDGDDDERKMRVIFACLTQDLLDAIEEFGYEAVYFGIGGAVFPEMREPSEGHRP